MEHITLPAFDDETGAVRTREMLEVEPLGNGRCRLLHSPAFVDGLAADDVIELDDAVRVGYHVVARGGNVCVVVVFTGDAEKQLGLAHASTFTAIGGRCEGGPMRVLVFTIPMSAGFPAIEAAAAALAGKVPGTEWWFGNIYDASGELLGWWE